MPAYIKNDVRKALDLELAIGETLSAMLQDPDASHAGDQKAAYEVSRARVSALQTLLKRAPDDEHLDHGI